MAGYQKGKEKMRERGKKGKRLGTMRVWVCVYPQIAPSRITPVSLTSLVEQLHLHTLWSIRPYQLAWVHSREYREKCIYW